MVKIKFNFSEHYKTPKFCQLSHPVCKLTFKSIETVSLEKKKKVAIFSDSNILVWKNQTMISHELDCDWLVSSNFSHFRLWKPL